MSPSNDTSVKPPPPRSWLTGIAERLKRLLSSGVATEPPILVYQMGKVGSSTVYRSLTESGLPLAVEQIQFLSDRWIADVERQYKAANAATPLNVVRSKVVARQIRESKNVCWKIISLVRDPIARNISSLFETMEPLSPALIGSDGNVDAQKATRHLLGQFATFDESSDYVCNWFDDEMRSVFGINVFQFPFCRETGTCRIRQGNVDLLILTLENLDWSYAPAIQQFLELDRPLDLVRANVAADKKHSAAYQQVLEQIRIPKSVCERIYSSRFCRHFYSNETRSNFIGRWSTGVSADQF